MTSSTGYDLNEHLKTHHMHTTASYSSVEGNVYVLLGNSQVPVQLRNYLCWQSQIND